MPRAFALIVLALLTPPGATAQEKLRDSPYYPLGVGTRWEYRCGDLRLTQRVIRHEKLGELLCAYVEIRNDQDLVVGAEHLAVAEGGIYRYSLNGQAAEPPVLLLKLPPKAGESWKVDSKIGGDLVKATFRTAGEDVTVPTGKYRAIRVSAEDARANDIPFGFSTCYAENVGVVKQILKLQTKELVFELVRFEPGR